MTEQQIEPISTTPKGVQFLLGAFQCLLATNSIAFLISLIALNLVESDETFKFLHLAFVWLPTIGYAIFQYLRKKPWIGNGILTAVFVSFVLSYWLRADFCVYPFPYSVLLAAFSM